MKNTICLAAVCLVAAGSVSMADTIRGINMEFVTIGNAGNAADTGGTVGCGAVGYNYRIGKYEVTNAQWNAFITAAGAPTGYTSTDYDQSAYFTGAQQPTNMVSWYEAAQFCNYLTSGDKSKGAYCFTGNNANPGQFWYTNRDAAKATYGTVYVIPNKNEWYKAAYYKPDGSGYSLYANGTNVAPVAGVDTNFNNVIGSLWNINNGTVEQNGTFNMMGNVREWNETLYANHTHYLCGGSAFGYGVSLLGSSYYRDNLAPDYEISNIGFRVVCIVPEPASVLFFVGGICAFIRKRSGR